MKPKITKIKAEQEKIHDYYQHENIKFLPPIENEVEDGKLKFQIHKVKTESEKNNNHVNILFHGLASNEIWNQLIASEIKEKNESNVYIITNPESCKLNNISNIEEIIENIHENHIQTIKNTIQYIIENENINRINLSGHSMMGRGVLDFVKRLTDKHYHEFDDLRKKIKNRKNTIEFNIVSHNPCLQLKENLELITSDNGTKVTTFLAEKITDLYNDTINYLEEQKGIDEKTKAKIVLFEKWIDKITEFTDTPKEKIKFAIKEYGLEKIIKIVNSLNKNDMTDLEFDMLMTFLTSQDRCIDKDNFSIKKLNVIIAEGDMAVENKTIENVFYEMKETKNQIELIISSGRHSNHETGRTNKGAKLIADLLTGVI